MKNLTIKFSLAVVLMVVVFSGLSCSTRTKTSTSPSAEGTDELALDVITTTIITQESSEPIVTNEKEPQAAAANTAGLLPIKIDLPKYVLQGTTQDAIVDNLEEQKPSYNPRPPFLAPQGTTNVALNKPVTSSDKFLLIGKLSDITNGDKDTTDGHTVQLFLGVQYITIDLGAMHDIYAVVVWHLHKQPYVFYDVIVQTANDENFTENANTIFNNDIDNSAGQGVGKDKHYYETYQGKLIDAKGIKGRYVRLFSNGLTAPPEEFN
jgi:hypothetical protein